MSNNPKVWGPIYWRRLHKTTFRYPEHIDPNNQQHQLIKARVRALFMSLKTTIPCKMCRDSYRGYLRQMPIDGYLGSREKLSYWLYKIHNKVNAKLRKMEHDQYNASLQKVEEYARIHRISPAQLASIKSTLKAQIMTTRADPTFEYVKRMYRDM